MLPLTEWIDKLFQYEPLTRMGHAQRTGDLNLGLGWVYYALVRSLRPQRIVSIGSYRGFVPMVLARGLADNNEGGQVTFIDPSLVDSFWCDPRAVQEHFASFGLTNIQHHRLTTQEFVRTKAYAELADIGLVFVDGLHTEEQAEIDFEAFQDRLSPSGVVLFHDSISTRTSRIYGEDRAYQFTVKHFLDRLKQRPDWQVFDLQVADGLSLVRRSVASQQRAAA
jgi:predicted O-methyltransferase YrrM